MYGGGWGVALKEQTGSISFMYQVDMEEISVETAMGRDFDRMVRTQLDPVWHILSAKTRQLVADLKTLRLVLK